MARTSMTDRAALYPFLVTLFAVAILALMDGFMKSAALAVGAFSALLIRSWLAVAVVVPAWLAMREARPSRAAVRVHLVRGVVASFMALTFFSALVYLPLAEAIALSFISPLIALALAALILKERIGRKAIIAALLGVAGVLVIVGGRIGRERLTDEAALGIALVLFSALLYAWNLVLQRQQALLALPVEIAAFQNIVVGCVLALGAPFVFVMPDTTRTWFDIGMTGLLSVSGAMMLAWAYRRAEAQALVPLEYTGFVWAALVGWAMFAERVTVTTLTGALLIVIGCWIAAPRKHPEPVVT